MRRRSRRRNPETLTLELREFQYRARLLEARAEILRKGVAAVLPHEDISREGYEACSSALSEASLCGTEATVLRTSIRAAQDAAEEDAEKNEATLGQVQ